MKYSAKINVHNGRVQAEIYYTCDPVSESLKGEKLEIHSYYKVFGRFWQSEPKEKDWIKAREWVQKHIQMIEKYSTSEVEIPHRNF